MWAHDDTKTSVDSPLSEFGSWAVSGNLTSLVEEKSKSSIVVGGTEALDPHECPTYSASEYKWESSSSPTVYTHTYSHWKDKCTICAQPSIVALASEEAKAYSQNKSKEEIGSITEPLGTA